MAAADPEAGAEAEAELAEAGALGFGDAAVLAGAAPTDAELGVAAAEALAEAAGALAAADVAGALTTEVDGLPAVEVAAPPQALRIRVAQSPADHIAD
ncbi:MAG: hypothetical protein JOZ39_00135 [Chloroflexi bacterium]|nr:hypothetical protein [Chloroflexota bacterium]